MYWTTLLALFFHPLPAQHTGMDAPKETQTNFKSEEFKPHMLFHFNEGCPTNSECSPEMGKRYQRFAEAVKEVEKNPRGFEYLDSLRKKSGIPFDLWTTEKAKAKEDIIIWDSPCRQHNLEDQKKIGIGLAMATDFIPLTKFEAEEKIYLRRLYRFQKGKDPETFYTFRGDTPIYFEDDRLVFKRMIEGHYYGVAVDNKGQVNVVNTTVPVDFPRSIDCPQEFLNSMKKITQPENLYSGVYCQKTWNKSTKDFETVLIGWSCN